MGPFGQGYSSSTHTLLWTAHKKANQGKKSLNLYLSLYVLLTDNNRYNSFFFLINFFIAAHGSGLFCFYKQPTVSFQNASWGVDVDTCSITTSTADPQALQR